jgi:hypothetical protein
MDILRYRIIRVVCSSLISGLLMVSFGLREAMSEDSNTEYKPSVLTLIKAKSRNAVFTAAGRFSLTSSSEIFDIQGSPLSIRDLPVPCMAKVRSEAGRYGGDPRVLRVQIQKVMQGATSDWKAQSPE